MLLYPKNYLYASPKMLNSSSEMRHLCFKGGDKKRQQKSTSMDEVRQRVVAWQLKGVTSVRHIRETTSIRGR